MVWVGMFLFFEMPGYGEINFKLGSNFETSGGYGPNQVSTALGLGILILGYLFLTKQKMFKIKYLDQFLLFVFVIRGLLTFSRGGVMVPIACLIIFYFINLTYKNRSRLRQKVKLKKVKTSQVVIAIVSVLVIFVYANIQTGGALLLRYQGETAGTLAGTKEVDLNHFVSHRVEIAEMDIALWLQNPFLGVGPGMSKFTEGGHFGFGSHVEYSRMLAEHGVLGLFALMIITFYPISYFRKIKDPFHKGLFAMFIAMAILTSFHAAMRTMVTPFFYGLAFAKFRIE